jgi:hypothetical protein
MESIVPGYQSELSKISIVPVLLIEKKRLTHSVLYLPSMTTMSNFLVRL